MALNKKKCRILKTTVKSHLEYLAENRDKLKINFTPRYVWENDLIRKREEVNKELYLKIMKLWKKEVERRLLRGETYSISNERDTNVHDRHTITLRVKRENKNTTQYRKFVERALKKNPFPNYKGNAEDLLLTPTLKLTMDTTFKLLKYQELRMTQSRWFGDKLELIPISQRYNFPKE